jgi:hypothetical protein
MVCRLGDHALGSDHRSGRKQKPDRIYSQDQNTSLICSKEKVP